jgi:hypothetical protein
VLSGPRSGAAWFGLCSGAASFRSIRIEGKAPSVREGVIDTKSVVVCSTDPVLSRVLGRNLEKRGFCVKQLDWEQLCNAGRLEAWRPYGFLRKPLGLRDLLTLLDELTAPGAVR